MEFKFFMEQIGKMVITKTIPVILIFSLLVSCNSETENFFSYETDKGIYLNENPRLLFPAGKEKEILDLAKSEPLLSDLITILRQEADNILDLPLQNEPVRLRVSREQIYRMTTLATAYRIFEEDKFAQRVEEELRNVSSFDSWNPSHFLDVAEMTTAVAIAYDWCYDFIDDETKTMVENAILTKAFEPAWPVYRDGDERSWAKRNTNWNVVTNSGLVTGALAIAHKYPDEAAEIIRNAVKYVPNNISYFAPEGVYYEGPAYWAYTNMYLSLLLDNLQRNLNHDFGLSSMEGVERTAEFYVRSLSPANLTHNFGNTGNLYTYATYLPIYFFYSNRFDQPEVAEFFRNYLKIAIDKHKADEEFNFSRFFFLSIPWFDNSELDQHKESPSLQVFRGIPDMLVFNGYSDDPADRLYLSAKGGRPDMAHNQLDVGSFVWDYQGVRWALDLGTDSYSLPGFWDYAVDGRRWDYIRNTNLGHNTLNIDGEIAHSDGLGTLLRSDTNNNQPYGIFDLGPSYKEQVETAYRGFKMLSPTVMLVMDEVEVKSNAKEVNWRLLTEAYTEIVNDGLIKLTLDNKNAYIAIPNSNESDIRIFDAEPNTSLERPIDGVKIIEVSIDTEDRSLINIPILLGNKADILKNYNYEAFVPLSEW